MSQMLMSIEYGGYISIIKFLIFLIFFFLWVSVLQWVHKDTGEVGTKGVYWTSIVFGAGAAGTIIWLFFPFFIVGMFAFVIFVSAAVISYIYHRNTIVMDFEKVLTPEHIKSLLSGEDKNLSELYSFGFITANNNEIPLPEPKTAEYYGYKTTSNILSDSVRKRASDILFTPKQQTYDVTYYIDGVALKQPSIDKAKLDYFIRFIKNLGGLDAEEKRKPQKGSFKTTIKNQRGLSEWEVQTAGSTVGEQIRIRHLTKSSINRLNELGLSAEHYEILSNIRDSKKGLFIISGPKKSGVTTTFYALVRNHDPFLNSVNTLEKKQALELPNITQNIFNIGDSDVNTYAKKLQNITRLGADVVGVADCTDTKTARAACQAAQEGKIIYVTLEANNVTELLHKWIRLVDDKKLAVENLLGISNQQLIRKLCEDCKQGYQPNKELLKKFNLSAEKAKILYRP